MHSNEHDHNHEETPAGPASDPEVSDRTTPDTSTPPQEPELESEPDTPEDASTPDDEDEGGVIPASVSARKSLGAMRFRSVDNMILQPREEEEL